ncbi:hypothetical protein FACS1894176_01470 [Bacteroidia bacterium]|nr:hypothetical protein FACS1894176_01470 [Bacteroidia bacterium]
MLQETLKDFSSYQGFKFEQLVRDFLILENKKGNLDFVFTKIGMWLDRKNHEIDLVYSDEKEHIVFLECKMNEKRINSAEKHQLSENVEAFFEKNPKFREIEMKV